MRHSNQMHPFSPLKSFGKRTWQKLDVKTPKHCNKSAKLFVVWDAALTVFLVLYIVGIVKSGIMPITVFVWSVATQELFPYYSKAARLTDVAVMVLPMKSKGQQIPMHLSSIVSTKTKLLWLRNYLLTSRSDLSVI